ncbi:BnaA09g47230D [Brassica napus]|uniref:BnaA09g47230D protein n=1 Tax=Brassica napus TaxID=3708 RepID=A0A078GMW5_BRANA|nr:BnaA09g47230D [Brassica napus]
MGGCFSVSVSCDQVVNQVFQCLCLKGSYIHNLPQNLLTLQKAMGALKAKRDDVQRKVEREEFTGQRRRLDQVQEEEKTPWNKTVTSPCFSNLTQVIIAYCHGLKDLTWLLFAPNLAHLRVTDSVQLEDIISKEKAESVLENNIIPFQKLEKLVLYELPELKSIYWNALPFQRLRHLIIRGNRCPKLRKLPLNSESVFDVEKLVIRCFDREWMERVEWEDEATRLRFLPLCTTHMMF